MFRAAPRLIARPTALRAVPRTFASPSRRQINTAPPSQQRRSWKSLFARIGVAGTLIYYYNTTEVFAEEPRQAVVQIPDTDVESEHLPTIEALSAERQKRKAVQAQLDAQKQKHADEGAAKASQGGLEGLEEEADQQGAFNPETGEINWDCPCLGGMADGPCGEQFKAAFSCFVYSSEEPKGMDCIDKFKDMQNCFREYPEIYGSELDSDADDEDDLTADAASDASVPQSTSTPPFSVGDESETQRRAPASEKSEGKLSGEKKTKAQDSTPPAPAPPQTTSSEPQSSPSKQSSTEGKLAGESGEQRSPPPSSSSTALVPNEYKPK